MSRQFDVPTFYRSPIIGQVKALRRQQDPRKQDLLPSVLDFGPVRFRLARHFGFCYGVENAIEIAYRALVENPGRRLFLLSEMIHNPQVNADLQARGIRFLRTTNGEQLIPFEELCPDDVVIIPAFGASVEVQAVLEARGVDVQAYNTTCPFVEKVWKRSTQIGKRQFTVVVHGKRYHEETRATFSHARQSAPVVVVRDLAEAQTLARVIRKELTAEAFFAHFSDRCSEGFDPDRDLERIGVVNQTTMLATETQAIADLLRQTMQVVYGTEHLARHFADTSDTLCYATNENQDATTALIQQGGDLALVVGGYNSSNTSHLVELCAAQMPTYFISDAGEVLSATCIRHFDLHTHTLQQTDGWLPSRTPLDLILTAGASCPDSLLDEVIRRILDFYPEAATPEAALEALEHGSA
jgi:4-hydroxy-3-methylbut-2-enyl diphosphate reductase